MFTEELLKFMKDNFEQDTKQIAKNYFTLQKNIDNAINNIVCKSCDLAKDKNFADAQLFLKRAEELNNISLQIGEYIKAFDETLLKNEWNNVKDLDSLNTNTNKENTEIAIEPCNVDQDKNVFTLKELLSCNDENIFNKKVLFFTLNGIKIDASNFKEVLVKTLTELGGIDKDKAYKLPQSTILNSKDSINFTFVKVKALKEPVEIKELGLYVETAHNNKALISLLGSLLEYYSISAIEMKICFSI